MISGYRCETIPPSHVMQYSKAFFVGRRSSRQEPFKLDCFQKRARVHGYARAASFSHGMLNRRGKASDTPLRTVHEDTADTTLSPTHHRTNGQNTDKRKVPGSCTRLPCLAVSQPTRHARSHMDTHIGADAHTCKRTRAHW